MKASCYRLLPATSIVQHFNDGHCISLCLGDSEVNFRVDLLDLFKFTCESFGKAFGHRKGVANVH